MSSELLLLHAASTWALVGLIWTVQLVQYPSFALVSAPDLGRFHEEHCRRITWVVAPLMGVELVTGLILAGTAGSVLIWLGLALIAVNWFCTALVSVPLHNRLNSDKPRVQRALVATNWIRTGAWSARGVLTAALLLPATSA